MQLAHFTYTALYYKTKYVFFYCTQSIRFDVHCPSRFWATPTCCIIRFCAIALHLTFVVLKDFVQSPPLDFCGTFCCIKILCAIVSTGRSLYQKILCNRLHQTFAISDDFVQSTLLDLCCIRIIFCNRFHQTFVVSEDSVQYSPPDS